MQWRTDCTGVVNGTPEAAQAAAAAGAAVSGFYATGEGSGQGSSTLNARMAQRALRYYR
jgi:hypothetical protein